MLASGSPRRRVLLRREGFRFDVAAADIDEQILDGETPEAMVVRLAVAKASSAARESGPGCVVLGADTAVVLDGSAMGKPVDESDAVRMLLTLSGRFHDVITGYALTDGPEAPPTEGIVKTRVGFRPIERNDAEQYVATGEPMDKAGAYAIQGLGRRFVSELDGSFTNVMGLPMETIAPLLVGYGIGRSDAAAT